MTDSGFIFMLVLGSCLLLGILATVHVSAHRLTKRLAARRVNTAEPEFEFGPRDLVMPGVKIKQNSWTATAVHVNPADLRQNA